MVEDDACEFSFCKVDVANVADFSAVVSFSVDVDSVADYETGCSVCERKVGVVCWGGREVVRLSLGCYLG